MLQVYDPREDTSVQISNEAQRFAGLLKTRPLTDTAKEYILKEIQSMSAQSASDYIMFALFPEFDKPVRFPMTFPNPTAVFKHHEHFDCLPSTYGKILIQLVPHQTFGIDSENTDHHDHYLRMYRHYNNTTAKFAGTDALRIRDTIGEYYESVVLRAAVIRAFYIGTEERMSGFLLGAFEYFAKHSDDHIPTVDDVEDGYYKQFRKPNEVIRVLWFPKDYADYNFD